MGCNVINRLCEDIKFLKGKRVLVISDSGIRKAGLVEIITDIISKKFEFEIFYDIEPEPSVSTVDKCVKYARKSNSDIIIGVGGGSVIDVAKATAVCLGNKNDIKNYYGINKVPEPSIPKILIPTTAGTGSEVGMYVVLTDENNFKQTIASKYLLADVTLIDPLMTISMPPNVTAETGADALSHAIEGYVSVKANTYSNMVGLEAIKLIGKFLLRAYANGNDIDARIGMSEASMLANMSYGASSLGAIHALAYSFTRYFGFSHGRSNAIIMPAVMRYNYIANQEKFSNIALALGGNIKNLPVSDAAAKVGDIVEDMINSMGIGTKISSYNIAKSELPKMAEYTLENYERLLRYNPRMMNLDQAYDVFLSTY